LIASQSPLQASIVLGSFGSSTPLKSHVFQLDLKRDPAAPLEIGKPTRYGKLPEIHHIFRPDPKSPPVLLTIIFGLAVFASLPILLGTWLTVGANLSHVTTAFSKAPVAHSIFFGSILAMEGVFLMYYLSWNLFQTLPAAVAVGFVAFLSGTRALTEVQERRLAGQR
jgi:oligosaccharyltransferase complex subunit delta (ribophorin II)